MAYSRFLDSATSSAVPSGSMAAYYVNGNYAWSTNEIRRMGSVIGIAVHPGQPSQAKLARCLDIERYDATIYDAVPFIQYRNGMGHYDATIYCSRSTWGGVWNLVRRTPGLHYRFWISTIGDSPPTLSPSPARWAPGSPTPWAVQYLGAGASGGNYDRSVLYGTNDFSPPSAVT